jgi:hypothetical protein
MANGKLNELMVKWFGASWKTTIAGGIAGFLIILQTMVDQGAVVPDISPIDWVGWLKFLFGAAIIWGFHETKQKGVSNAPSPVPAKAVEIPGKVKSVIVDRNNP